MLWFRLSRLEEDVPAWICGAPAALGGWLHPLLQTADFKQSEKGRTPCWVSSNLGMWGVGAG